MQNKDGYMYDHPTIDPYKIIRIVNAAWPKSFSRIESNKKAIVERGWLPYNRELMPHPMIRASIINEEEELESGDYTKIIIPQHNIHKIIDLANDAPIFNPRYITAPPTNPAATIPNFKSGVAVWCPDTIVKDHDFNTTSARIKKNIKQGQSLKTKLCESKKTTSGRLFKAGSFRIGQKIFDIRKERKYEERQIQNSLIAKARNIYHKAKESADAIIALQLDPTKWSTAQLKIILTLLKIKSDGAMPTKRRNDWKLACFGKTESNCRMKRRRKRHWRMDGMKGMEEMREMERMEMMMFKERQMRTKRLTQSSTFTR